MNRVFKNIARVALFSALSLGVFAANLESGRWVPENKVALEKMIQIKGIMQYLIGITLLFIKILKKTYLDIK